MHVHNNWVIYTVPHILLIDLSVPSASQDKCAKPYYSVSMAKIKHSLIMCNCTYLNLNLYEATHTHRLLDTVD